MEKGLKRLGTVLHVTPNGYIVVTVDDPERLPPLGVKVYSGDRRELGQLLDVIGPVKQPYAVVRPASRELLKVVKEGDAIYYRPPRPPRRRRVRPSRPRGRRGEPKGRGRGRQGRRQLSRR